MFNSQYNPKEYEEKILKLWDDSGAANPDNLKLSPDAAPFSIIMPPPNVTGVLHLGHAMENAIMDAMARFQRLRGNRVLLLPGTDHAAVATQARVEKNLIAGGMKNPRQELGREKLLAEIHDFAENSKKTILNQIKRLGTSCDWSRLAYTMDEVRSRAVNEVFIRAYGDGLIYRGFRAVNWSVKGQSTCSDDELEHIERDAKIYTFKYSKDFPLSIATTRPETKLGDTAVAVNPRDERYSKYIGQVFTVDVGATKPLQIKIIGSQAVDPEFGTGAVGVTPAHSHADYEMYEKQKAAGDEINLIQVIGQDGRMTENAGSDYNGLTVEEAREKFVAWLRANELLEKEEDIKQNIGVSDRFGDIVEVLPLTQWFVAVDRPFGEAQKTLKQLMREAVDGGLDGDWERKIEIAPENFKKIYLHWIDNLRDWCISRQIWWGHRIPVWYKGNEVFAGVNAPDATGWTQDDDTLDTWFSSALWTFSTLGWPDTTDDFQKFHPTTWMQMGYEILFFWMARMILMSAYILNDVPFRKVYIHGILRDKDGRKFSKSLGNGIDPLEICDEYGTDALRASILDGITPGGDSRFYIEKVEGAKHLANKLWNISKFVYGFAENEMAEEINKIEADIDAADAWILSEFKRLNVKITANMENADFSQALDGLREFSRDHFADWYLEIAKASPARHRNIILKYILESLLKFYHPFMPFITEAIWQESGHSTLLMTEKWPDELNINGDLEEKAQNFAQVKNIIAAIRNARSEHKIEPARKIGAKIFTQNPDKLFIYADLIQKMRTGISDLEITEKSNKIENAIFVAVGDVEIYLLGAVDEEKEKARLQKLITEKTAQAEAISVRLANDEFAKKAPENIVATERAKLNAIQEEINNARERIG